MRILRGMLSVIETESFKGSCIEAIESLEAERSVEAENVLGDFNTAEILDIAENITDEDIDLYSSTESLNEQLFGGMNFKKY